MKGEKVILQLGINTNKSREQKDNNAQYSISYGKLTTLENVVIQKKFFMGQIYEL